MKNINLQKVAIVYLWFGKKIMLCKRKTGIYSGMYGCAGGKIEDGEDILDGLVRETKEETNFFIYKYVLNLIDCYIIKDANKVFVFEAFKDDYEFLYIKNTEPTKHEKWKLFTIKDALKLNLTPHLKFYLENK